MTETATSDVVADTPPVWTSPSFWVTAITATVSLVCGVLALFVHHPVHSTVPDGVIGAAAFLAASITTAVLAHGRARVKAALITARATVHAANISALAVASPHSLTPRSASQPLAATDPSPEPPKPVRKTTTTRRTRRGD